MLYAVERRDDWTGLESLEPRTLLSAAIQKAPPPATTDSGSGGEYCILPVLPPCEYPADTGEDDDRCGAVDPDWIDDSYEYVDDWVDEEWDDAWDDWVDEEWDESYWQDWGWDEDWDYDEEWAYHCDFGDWDGDGQWDEELFFECPEYFGEDYEAWFTTCDFSDPPLGADDGEMYTDKGYVDRPVYFNGALAGWSRRQDIEATEPDGSSSEDDAAEPIETDVEVVEDVPPVELQSQPGTSTLPQVSWRNRSNVKKVRVELSRNARRVVEVLQLTRGGASSNLVEDIEVKSKGDFKLRPVRQGSAELGDDSAATSLRIVFNPKDDGVGRSRGRLVIKTDTGKQVIRLVGVRPR